MLEDPSGRLWVGIDKGLWIYAADKFTAVTDLKGQALQGEVRSLALDDQQTIWAAVRDKSNRLVRIRDDKVVEEFSAPAVPGTKVMATDFHGGMWLGLLNGDLALLRSGRLEQQVATHLKAPVRDILTIDDGAVFGATDKGLVVFRQGATRVLAEKDGLPCDSVNGVTKGEGNSLWLYMSCGLVRVSLPDLERTLQEPEHRVAVEIFDVFDGVRPGYAPYNRLTRGPDGVLWFANGVSLQTLDPRRADRGVDKLPVHVEQIVADHKPYPATEGLTLPPLTRDVQIDYTATELSVPQRVNFRYRLDGHDKDWTDAQTRRQAFYTDLPPGDYNFRVAASPGGGQWTEIPAGFKFSVPPAFYQTRLFMLLIVATLAVMIWWFVSWRIAQAKRQMRTRFEERHAERERIARELHDTFLQSVHGLMLRFQSVMERIPTTQPARVLMERALDLADDVIAEGRDQVTQLRTLQADQGDLPGALQMIGDELAYEGCASFRLTTEGARRIVDPGVSHELQRIAREAIANAIRHAQASQIDVSLISGRSGLTLNVIDDGRGFDADTVKEHGPPGHWGLKGMHERAASVRGRLVISSRPGAGTAVEITVPGSVAFQRTPGKWHQRLRALRMAFTGSGPASRVPSDNQE